MVVLSQRLQRGGGVGVGVGNPHRVLNVMSSFGSESHFDRMGSFSTCCGEEDIIEAADSAGGGWRGSGELGASWVRSLVLTVSVTKDVEVDVGIGSITHEIWHEKWHLFENKQLFW